MRALTLRECSEDQGAGGCTLQDISDAP